MANDISKIQKYIDRAIDTYLVADSKTANLVNSQKYLDLNFSETGYVKVMSIAMDPLAPYKRVNEGDTAQDYSHYLDGSADGYKIGSTKNEWELFKLSYDRGRQFQVDNVSDEETAGLVIGNLLTEFIRTKVVPEIDEVRFSKIASYCSETLGNYIEEDISANQIISKFNAAYEWLSENEVPQEDQVIYVSPAVMALIRNTTELFKRLTQEDVRDGDITTTITKYEGREIVEVPSSRFFTDVAVNIGFAPTANSKVINFLICSKKAVIPVVKVEKSKVWTPDAVQNFDGYKVNFRLFHDLIIPKNKIVAAYVSVSKSKVATKVNGLLKVALSKASDGKYVLDNYYTAPAGIFGAKVVHGTTAFTLGATDTSSTEIVKGVETALTGDQYFALLDSKGVVVACSEKITLPTK